MSLGNEWQTVQSALAGLERIFQVLALPPSSSRPEAHHPPYRSNAAIEMRQVCWLPAQPPGAAWHFSGGAAREHIVLVGRTGAGKSSVLHLLGGLYTRGAEHSRYLVPTQQY